MTLKYYYFLCAFIHFIFTAQLILFLYKYRIVARNTFASHTFLHISSLYSLCVSRMIPYSADNARTPYDLYCPELQDTHIYKSVM